MWEILLVLTLFLVFFAYFGYPLSLWVIGLVRAREVARAPIRPQVSLIITVCNEEKRIREKLDNSLELDYPPERLQILVVSDGSTDQTCAIVEEYSPRGVELLAFPVQRGKEFSQRDAVAEARGEILVFSDVATRLEPAGLTNIVANFADPTVGCVSSVDRVLDHHGRPGGEGAYVRYEMWLRALESRVHSVVGLSGSFFAARREVCQDFSGEMQSDFRTLLSSMKLGLRGVSDPHSVGCYQDLADVRREFDRKVRTVLRGLTVFFRHLEFLNPFRYGRFAYQYFCHKLLRWMVPFLLAVALASNLVLAFDSTAYALLLALQVIFYLAAGLHFAGLGGRSPWLRLPRYFVTVNLAILVAWWRYLRGRRMVMWAPSER